MKLHYKPVSWDAHNFCIHWRPLGVAQERLVLDCRNKRNTLDFGIWSNKTRPMWCRYCWAGAIYIYAMLSQVIKLKLKTWQVLRQRSFHPENYRIRTTVSKILQILPQWHRTFQHKPPLWFSHFKLLFENENGPRAPSSGLQRDWKTNVFTR